jgi:protein-S-isoprenylcysteine O-methyltransferase Ste14
MAAAAGRQFRRSGTTFDTIHPNKAAVLVTAGSNTVSRNPMYVGLTGLLLAHAVFRGSWGAVAPVAAFVAVIDRMQIPAEESALLAKFGPTYEAYRAATPRWLDARSLRLRKPSR